MEMLKGNTPFFSRIKASMGTSMRQSESTEGAGGGYSNRAASGLGGYEESVEMTADIDQDHPNNVMSAKARVEGVEKDRPHETKPGQPESGVGTTIDKML
jgi:phage-related protein